MVFRLDVQGGELPVLPMSVYGSVVMGRGENYESDPSKFFFYLYARTVRPVGSGPMQNWGKASQPGFIGVYGSVHPFERGGGGYEFCI